MTANDVETAEYQILFEPQYAILRVVLLGHWSMAIEERFEQDLDRAKLKSRASAPYLSDLKILIDGRQHGVQSQAVIQRLARYSETLSSDVKKTAVIVESALHRLQAQRLADNESHKVFVNEDAAIKWLIAAST